MSDQIKNPFIKPEYVIKCALAGWEFKDRRAAEMAVIYLHNVDRMDIKPLIVLRAPLDIDKTWLDHVGCSPFTFAPPAKTDSRSMWRAFERCITRSVPVALFEGLRRRAFWRSAPDLRALHRSALFCRPFHGELKTIENRTAFVITTSDPDFPRHHPDLHLLNVDIVGHDGSSTPTVPPSDVREAARAFLSETPDRDWRKSILLPVTGSEELP
ncbi:MAG: hypothetical protein IV100_17745 [Myxococcales bacterium]|nr:hypothetical protein [Myxococcales bacterium]